MQAVQCEKCNSIDVVRQGDSYVCLACGTRYESGVANLNRVSIDHSDEIQNLFRAARRARELGNYDAAQGYYDDVLSKNPDSWEAVFNTVYLRILQDRIGNIDSDARKMRDTLPTVLELVRDEYTIEEQEEAIVRISYDLSNLDGLLQGAAVGLHANQTVSATATMLSGGVANFATGAINMASANLSRDTTKSLCAEMLLSFGVAAYAAFGQELASRAKAVKALDDAMISAGKIYSSLGNTAAESQCGEIARQWNPEFKTERERILAYFNTEPEKPAEDKPKKKRKWFGF